MRLICANDYIEYITKFPDCTSDELARGVIAGRRLQDDLLYVLKQFIDKSTDSAIKKHTIVKDNNRDIVVIKCYK